MTPFAFLENKPDLYTLEIPSERIRLVSISKAYEQAIFDEFTSDIATYMIPKPAEAIEETREFIVSSLAAFEDANNLQFVIVDKETSEFLGCCGLHGRKDTRNPEFGIWLKKSAHGRGLGREAITTLARWAQAHIDLDSFIYPVDKRNAPSRAIPLSLGGQLIGERLETGMAGNILEEVIYQISAPLFGE